jgi:predicted oxidoreductase
MQKQIQQKQKLRFHSISFFMRLFVVLFLAQFLSIWALVPKVKLCEYDGCPEVSRLGLGGLHLGDSISGLTNATEINSWILTAVSYGITLFDLADVYPVKGGDSGSSAELFGQALAMTPGLREQITIVAKMDIIFPTTIDTSRDHLTSTLNWFLSALQTTYVDVMLLHYPNSYMNATEVAELFVEFKSQGKVLHFGVSNHYVPHFELLQKKLDAVSGSTIRLVTNEIEVSVWNPSYLNYNSGLVDHAYQSGYHNLGWSSLGGDPVGGLNRLFVRKGQRQERILHALRTVARDLDISDPATVALLWVLSHPSGIIPLLGTTSLDRVAQYADVFQYLGRMSVEQWWTIGTAGGLCALADSQCNYSEYMPSD